MVVSIGEKGEPLLRGHAQAVLEFGQEQFDFFFGSAVDVAIPGLQEFDQFRPIRRALFDVGGR
jgi:hypothetical protein